MTAAARAARLSAALRVAGLLLAAALAVGAALAAQQDGRAGLGGVVAAFAIAAAVPLARSAWPQPPAAEPAGRLALAAGLTGTVLAGWLLYRPVLSAWYLADDLRFAVALGGMPPAELWSWWWPGRGESVQVLRPLPHMLTWGLLQVFGLDAGPAHAVNLALHLGSAVLLGSIAARATGQAGAGALAAAGYALSPLALPTVAWLNTHQDPMATFLSLAAAALLLAASTGRRGARAASAVCMAGALLCKESALGVPFALVALALGFDPRARTGRGLARAVGPHLAVLALYLGYRLWLFGGLGGYLAEGKATAMGMRPGSLRAVLLELPGVFLVPANAAIVPRVAALRPAVSALAVLLLVAALSGRREPRALRLGAFGLAWIGAGLVPVHNMLWMGPELLNARFLYLAAAGVPLVVAGLAASRGRVASAAVAAGFLALSLGLSVANRDQWLANAALPASIAAHLRAHDRDPPIGEVTLVGFPPYWRGSYVFSLELVPELALGRPVAVAWRRSDGEAGRRGPEPAAGRRLFYRFTDDERLWRAAEGQPPP